MSATFSKFERSSVGPSASGFGSHVEELHEFFKTRGVAFGSPDDLTPFVERLDSDAGFRDEIASMVRAIIYRERDGLSWAELMELLAAAVGGAGVDDATSPEVREAVRKLMAFVEGVFRTRRNPGAAGEAATVPGAVPETVREEQGVLEDAAMHAPPEHEVAEAAAAAHVGTDLFYRAQMTAQGETADSFADVPKTEDEIEAENVPYTNFHVPLEDFEDQGTTERGSPVWLWVAGACALLLAFCAGLFVHQRLIVPLRDPNTPYEAPPAETQQQPAGVPTAAPVANAAPATGTASLDERPTRVPGARPSTAKAAGGDANLRPKYMAPAAIGASPALMESHLVYAPPPSYPMMAEMTRVQGKVMVEAVVGKDGRVIRAQAISGHHLLRGAAVREVYARRYRPYTLNDRPMDVATLVTVDFKLKR